MVRFLIVFLLIPQFAQAQKPAKCERDFQRFEQWRDDVRAEALSNGISMKTWNASEPFIIVDKSITAQDRGQANFYDNFLKFIVPRTKRLLPFAQKKYAQHAELLAKVEKEYRVPKEVLIALWGMESDFADKQAKGVKSVLTSTATLAYDCRRPAMFREKLLAALTVIERGMFEPSTYLGRWAGEIGGFQFTPPNILKFGVDFDGDGRIDLINSVPDMIASAANMLKEYGWRPGQDIMDEVRLPDDLPWHAADVTGETKQPRAIWAHWGVVGPDGRTVSTDKQQASLILPMGRLGPAFLTVANFEVLRKWNPSLNNALAIAHLASRLGPKPAGEIYPGKGTVYVFSPEEMTELQLLLKARGVYKGDIDGRLGYGVRSAVREMQIKFKMPADSYPTLELLSALRGKS